jgi:uncharacterized protein YbjT (DUF2867 family)
MNQQIDRSGAAAKLDLGSFPVGGVAVVFGASGGIGGALAEALRKVETFAHVIALSRASAPAIDLLDEASLERAARFAADQGELRLVIDATGFLHDAQQQPEKTWRQRADHETRTAAAAQVGQGCFRNAIRQGRQHRR